MRGNFEVECEVTGFGYQETNLWVAGRWVAPVYTFRHVDIGDMRESQRPVLDPPWLPINEGHRVGPNRKWQQLGDLPMLMQALNNEDPAVQLRREDVPRYVCGVGRFQGSPLFRANTDFDARPAAS